MVSRQDAGLQVIIPLLTATFQAPFSGVAYPLKPSSALRRPACDCCITKLPNKFGSGGVNKESRRIIPQHHFPRSTSAGGMSMGLGSERTGPASPLGAGGWRSSLSSTPCSLGRFAEAPERSVRGSRHAGGWHSPGPDYCYQDHISRPWISNFTRTPMDASFLACN